MIKSKLRRTWYEISDYLSSNISNPLRIAELVNRISPRCWTFKFTFKNDRTDLQIDCDPVLSDDDALSLLDGSLNEVFFADSIYLRHGGKCLTEATARLLKESQRSNQLSLQDSDRESECLLALEGYWQSDWLPPELQPNPSILGYFLENTWLGSPKFADSENFVRWTVFGDEMLIRPKNRYDSKLNSKTSFTTQTDLYNTAGGFLGEASFHTSPSLESDTVYTMFGPLFPQPKNWLIRRREDPRWIVELHSQQMIRAVFQGEPVAKITNELVGAVEAAHISVTKSDDFKLHKEQLQREELAKAADRLRQRQARAQNAEKVTFDGEPVMLVPANENEVLALLCKLESRGALPFHEFLLWEYTSRVGIDAIGTYQIRETDVPAQFASIEVEHYFENFFDHEHPHSQVNLVICWDFRDGEAPSELRQHNQKKYLFEYRNDYSFIVVVLSHIPGLQVKRS